MSPKVSKFASHLESEHDTQNTQKQHTWLRTLFITMSFTIERENDN